MAIVNVTPDSFFAGSRTPDAEAIERRVREAADAGCDLFDVGGYSSRPGAAEVTSEEEWRRVEAGVAAVRRIAPTLPVSVDTFRAEVARWQALGVAAVWQPRLEVFGAEDLHTPDETLERFVGTPRMTAPARSLALTLDVRLQSTIRHIERSPAGWRLVTAEQGPLDEHFDAVVLAVPSPHASPCAAYFCQIAERGL